MSTPAVEIDDLSIRDVPHQLLAEREDAVIVCYAAVHDRTVSKLQLVDADDWHFGGMVWKVSLLIFHDLLHVVEVRTQSRSPTPLLLGDFCAVLDFF